MGQHDPLMPQGLAVRVEDEYSPPGIGAPAGICGTIAIAYDDPHKLHFHTQGPATQTHSHADQQTRHQL